MAGYQKLVLRRAIWLISTGIAGATAIVFLAVTTNVAVGLACLFVIMTAAVVLPITAITYWRRGRVLDILHAYPWREFSCGYPPEAPSNPTLIWVRFEDDYAPTFRIIPFPVPLAETENEHPDRIWFAGDPRFGGVVSPVGGHYPVRVVPHEGGGAAGWGRPEDDALARRVGLVRRSGKGTQT
ncbi:hypothetical protein [Streptomyces sp. NPDC012888]|uniref:hypothetical protein n=1 Tax=Streptomyces sp. NPDC012888 TaxID=3364855 RepID=UPI00367F8BE3